MLEVFPSSMIINVAAKTQNHNGNTGIGWRLQKEDGGMNLAKARIHNADHHGCFAELQAVKKTMMEAHKWKVKKVEVRLDVKAMVTWLQKKVPPLPDAYVINPIN